MTQSDRLHQERTEHLEMLADLYNQSANTEDKDKRAELAKIISVTCCALAAITAALTKLEGG